MSGKRYQLLCHKCGSTDLILREVHQEVAEFDEGLFVNEHDEIEAAGQGQSSAGNIMLELTRIECGDCGHEWRPRRRFAGGIAS